MATAVWLVENTTLTFKQIAEFCKLHEVEIQVQMEKLLKELKHIIQLFQANYLEKKLNFHLKIKLDHYKLKVMIFRFQMKKKN